MIKSISSNFADEQAVGKQLVRRCAIGSRKDNTDREAQTEATITGDRSACSTDCIAVGYYPTVLNGKTEHRLSDLLARQAGQLKMANSKYEYVRENEEYLNKTLLNDCYTVIRIDGSKFHHFSSAHDYIKPNDKRALDLMNAAALYVVKLYFPNIICAYGQSDEYSFVLSKRSGLFNRRLNKLNSMLVSAFASAFTFNWSKFFGDRRNLLSDIDRTSGDKPGDVQADRSVGSQTDSQTNGTLSRPLENAQDDERDCSPEDEQEDSPVKSQRSDKCSQIFREFVELKYPPAFDSRCVLYTSDEEIKDYLKWRQVDCHVNNLYNTTFYALTGKYAKWHVDEASNRYRPEIAEFENALTPQQAEARLRGTFSKEKREEVLKGTFGIEYELEAEQFRRGSLIVFEKKDEQLFNKWQECLLSKKKKKLDQFDLDDFINFQILHQEFIQSDYLDNYLAKVDGFVSSKL